MKCVLLFHVSNERGVNPLDILSAFLIKSEFLNIFFTKGHTVFISPLITFLGQFRSFEINGHFSHFGGK